MLFVAQRLTRLSQQQPKLDRFGKHRAHIRTFPLSDPTPPRPSPAIAVFAFHIPFFGCAVFAAGRGRLDLRRILGVVGQLFTQTEGALHPSHLASSTASTTATTTTEHHLSTVHDICHLIRRGNNTTHRSSRHELLLLHPANATGASGRIALPAPPDFSHFEWLFSLLQCIESKPTKPIEYTVQCRLEWICTSRSPARTKRGDGALPTTIRKLLWIGRVNSGRGNCRHAEGSTTTTAGFSAVALT